MFIKKALLALGLVTLVGCSASPIQYDLTAEDTLIVVKSERNIPNIQVGEFKYEPHIKISQYTMSVFGCIPCQSDGSTAGLTYTKPINEIVKSETKIALDEIVLPSKNSSCSLDATIHLAARDNLVGSEIIDLSYMLVKDDEIKFIKRIRSEYDKGLLFQSWLRRSLANTSRQALGELVTNTAFLEVVEQSCSSS
ncbi:hypothetical protein [Vibrio sp. HN007]|uniref:hypothetical protein n=1 Tax=Vibrio iocasae TaxID=3098914 RepID=UPI0035D4F641